MSSKKVRRRLTIGVRVLNALAPLYLATETYRSTLQCEKSVKRGNVLLMRARATIWDLIHEASLSETHLYGRKRISSPDPDPKT